MYDARASGDDRGHLGPRLMRTQCARSARTWLNGKALHSGKYSNPRLALFGTLFIVRQENCSLGGLGGALSAVQAQCNYLGVWPY